MLDPLLWLVMLAVYAAAHRARVAPRIAACAFAAACLSIGLFELNVWRHGYTGRPVPFWTLPTAAAASALQGAAIALLVAAADRLLRRHPID
jgi:hypothetical protein